MKRFFGLVGLGLVVLVGVLVYRALTFTLEQGPLPPAMAVAVDDDAAVARLAAALRIPTVANSTEPHFDPAAFDAWESGWRARLATEPPPEALLQASNPAFIPRNHRIEEMISAAVAGDYALFHRLNTVLSRPFDDQPEASDLTRAPLPAEIVPATFCGT